MSDRLAIESRLSLLFSTMEARKASLRREREDAKLSRRRYWWQEQQTNKTNKTLCPDNP